MKHTNTELTDIYSNYKGDSLHAEYFIAVYEKSYEEFEKFQDWEDENESVEEHTLKFCLELYLSLFLKYLKIGNGPEWSNEIADSVEEESNAVLYTYHKLKKENPDLAKKELGIYAKSLSNDECFITYYIFLMEHDFAKNIKERAFDYSKIFKEEIANGKSEIYAHEYADCRVSTEGNSKLFCEAYAFAYDKSIREGETENFSRDFSDKFGDFVVNGYLNYHNDVDLNLLERTLDEMKLLKNKS